MNLNIDLNNKNIIKKIKLIKEGKLKAEENVIFFLDRIKNLNEKYNIYIDINDNAINEAKIIDNKIKDKKQVGKLAGICFAIKANINVKNLKISCASKVLENYIGSYDADVIKKLKKEDAIILGIVNCDEFACGSSGETSAFGPTINPLSPKRIPGGSSSGSAAAIAANLADLSLGSDTGGSIRNPASHCGVIGIKPTYGRVSRYGLIDLSMSLDQIGPLGNDLNGVALTLEIISGNSINDPSTFNKPLEKYSEIVLKENYKIGIIKEFKEMIIDDEIKRNYKEIIEKLSKNNTIKEISLKHIKLGIETYYPIVYTEFFSGTRKFDGIKYGKKIEDYCGKEVLRRILGGYEISRSEFKGTYYRKALKTKEIITKELEEGLKGIDFIITPVTPKLPHYIGTQLTPNEMYAYDAFTIPANLAGLPGGVASYKIIEKNNEKINIGIQIITNKFNEKKLIEGLKLIETLHKE